jgi:hypothetical protein
MQAGMTQDLGHRPILRHGLFAFVERMHHRWVKRKESVHRTFQPEVFALFLRGGEGRNNQIERGKSINNNTRSIEEESSYCRKKWLLFSSRLGLDKWKDKDRA